MAARTPQQPRAAHRDPARQAAGAGGGAPRRPVAAAHRGLLAPTRETLTPTLRAQLIAREYELVALAAGGTLRGVYVQPSKRDAFREWTGALFIRQPSNPFSGGVFKFLVSFPDGYPFDPPEARFATPVFHPAVSPEGQMDLGRWFQNLTPFRDNIALELLQAVKALFFRYQCRDQPLNKEANAAVARGSGEFETRARKCVSEADARIHSLNSKFPTAIRFQDVNPDFATKVCENLGRDANEQGERQDQRPILEWFQENLIVLSSAMHGSTDA